MVTITLPGWVMWALGIWLVLLGVNSLLNIILRLLKHQLIELRTEQLVRVLKAKVEKSDEPKAE